MTPLSGLKDSLDENRLSEGRRLKRASISPLQADEQHGRLHVLGWPQQSVTQATGVGLDVLHKQASLMVRCVAPGSLTAGQRCWQHLPCYAWNCMALMATEVLAAGCYWPRGEIISD